MTLCKPIMSGNNAENMLHSDIQDNAEESLEYSVLTQNRFTDVEDMGDSSQNGGQGQWSVVNNKHREAKRKRLSTGNSVSGDEFSKYTQDEKLDHIFQCMNLNSKTLTKVDQNQIQCLTDMQNMISNMQAVNDRVVQIENRMSEQERMLKLLAYKSIDLEAREMRNNLIFYGINEHSFPGQSEANIILDILEHELGFDTEDMLIDRAHRLGQVRHAHKDREEDPRRPIVVRFHYYSDTEDILRKAYKLRGKGYGVDRQYPQEIKKARRELFNSQAAREARQQRGKVVIKFPAKLFINGQFVEDKFPEWFPTLRGSRILYEPLQTSTQHKHYRCTEETHKNQRLYSNSTVCDSPRHASALRSPSGHTTQNTNSIECQGSPVSNTETIRKQIYNESSPVGHAPSNINNVHDTGIRSQENAQNTLKFSDIVKSTPKHSLPASSSAGIQQRNSSRGRSRNRTSRNNINASKTRVTQTSNLSQTESSPVPKTRQTNTPTNDGASTASKNRPTENRSTNAASNNQHSDTGQQSARVH